MRVERGRKAKSRIQEERSIKEEETKSRTEKRRVD